VKSVKNNKSTDNDKFIIYYVLSVIM